jgi:hypothetical protein
MWGMIDAQFNGWRWLVRKGTRNQATRTTHRAGLHD